MRKMAIFVALFVTVAAWGCSGDDNSAVDAVKDKAGDVKDAAGDAKDAVGDAGEKVAGAAGDMAEGAMNQMKEQFEKQLGAFDEQLSSLKTVAAKFNDGELNGYVETIGTKLAGAKKAMTDAMTGQDFDMGKIKEMMTSMVAELTGLFSAANDKAKTLEG